MTRPKVLLVVGTLRKNGFNAQLADIINSKLQDQAEVNFLDYSDLPLMNQDLENPELPVVQRIRQEFRDADGIWFVSPQYNASFPGHVKNLVDWMSRALPGKGRDTAVIGGKKVTVSGAGGMTATAQMRAALDALLTFVGAEVMSEPEAGLTLAGESWTSGNLVLSDEDIDLINRQVEAFLKFIQA